MPGAGLRLSCDARGRWRVLYAAHTLQEQWGLPCGAASASVRALWRAVHRPDRRRVAQALAASRITGVAAPIDFRLRGHDSGAPRWVTAHTTVRRDEDGSTRWQCRLSDVTDQRQLEQQLCDLDRLQDVAVLATGVAHDVDQLLEAIRGVAELCRDEAPAGTPQRRRLDHVLEVSGHATGLLRQLLDFAHLAPQEHRPTTLAQLLQRCEPLLTAGLPLGLWVHTCVDEDAPVCVDLGQIEQCLLSLVSNAAHAMRERGGRISVLADRVRQIVSGDRSVPMARLRVIDHGEGIPPPLLPRMFEPFFTTKPAGQGTGLGLAAVKGIVQAHGGSVRVRSVRGQGSEFSLLLPLHSAGAPAAAALPQAPMPLAA